MKKITKENISKIKVIQAPLAGVSDIVFRNLVRKNSSSCLLTTEMISSEMLCNCAKQSAKSDVAAAATLLKNQRIIEFCEIEYPLSFQLVGHKIDKMVRAAKLLAPIASMIDLNFGCPVRKVIVSGDGSAMMKTPKLAYDILRAIKEETGLMVSAKFRLGFTKEDENFVEFGQILESAGADFVTLHGRTRSEMYQGKSDWQKIKILKENLSIPVFANGDITSIYDAVECLNLTKCDGVSIGRGIMGDFTLPYRIEKYLETGEIIEEPDLKTKIGMLKTHLHLEIERIGEIKGIKFMRKFFGYYIENVKNAAKYRNALVRMESEKEITDFLDLILDDVSKGALT